MTRLFSCRKATGFLVVGFGLLALLGRVAAAGEPAIPGYADYARFQDQVQSLATADLVQLRSLGTTLGHREVYVLEIGMGQRDKKPAMLIVGGVHPPHLVGSELALRIAKRLVAKSGDPAVRKLLDRMTFYVIPRPAPDACEAFFRKPYRERTENERPSAPGRDAEMDEGGPADLNGDGLVTVMRVEDGAGSLVEHATDPRVMVPAGSERKEQRRYSMYVEGRGNDEEKKGFHVPSAAGVAFDKNFPFRYPYFEAGAGPNAVSEVETRAVADFAFEHPNIAAVLTFAPEDNLVQPWKPDPADTRPLKTAVPAADAPYYSHLSETYREIYGRKELPESPASDAAAQRGSFAQWAYFYYGRWSFTCRGWWIPPVEVPGADKKKDPGDAANKINEKPNSQETRKSPRDAESARKPEGSSAGAEELNVLRWFARQKIDGFVPWKAIEHPDLAGRKVEVGGFKPFVRLNPPAGQLDPLAEKHWTFVERLAGMLPRVAIDSVRVEPLSGGVWRIKAVVVNQAYLPTMPDMGRITREPKVLQLKIELPKEVNLVTGTARAVLPALVGGGRTEHQWLVMVPGGKPVSLPIRVWCPSVGEEVRTVQLVAQSGKEKTP